MGLDIYLYETGQHEADEAYEAAWEALYHRKESGEIDQVEYDHLRGELPKAGGHADVRSERYPDHLFNRRYLRSSYNGSGFNNAVPDLLGEDHGLYWIFEPMGQLSSEWLKFSDDDALRMVREALAKPSASPDSWYSSRDLNMYGEGVTILASVPGAEKRFFSDEPWPAVHLVYRSKDDGLDSYVQAAEITAEFCDEAIALIERDGSAYLSWSG